MNFLTFCSREVAEAPVVRFDRKPVVLLDAIPVLVGTYLRLGTALARGASVSLIDPNKLANSLICWSSEVKLLRVADGEDFKIFRSASADSKSRLSRLLIFRDGIFRLVLLKKVCD